MLDGQTRTGFRSLGVMGMWDCLIHEKCPSLIVSLLLSSHLTMLRGVLCLKQVS